MAVSRALVGVAELFLEEDGAFGAAVDGVLVLDNLTDAVLLVGVTA